MGYVACSDPARVMTILLALSGVCLGFTSAVARAQDVDQAPVNATADEVAKPETLVEKTAGAGQEGRLAGITAAAAALGVRKNIVAIVPAVENMPSGTAYRPGDVLRMMSGKTVEVLSTGERFELEAQTAGDRGFSKPVLAELAT